MSLQLLISWCYEYCLCAIIHAIEWIIYRNVRLFDAGATTSSILVMRHTLPLLPHYSLRVRAWKRERRARPAYVKHMIWYKKRTNVLGDVYRKLKRKLWIFITEKKKETLRWLVHFLHVHPACSGHVLPEGGKGGGKECVINAPTPRLSPSRNFAVLTCKYRR